MIRLAKGSEPQVLVDNGAAWTQEYLDALEAGHVPDSVRYRYRDPAIKAAIVDEAFEKCVYCESKVRHVYPGDTEHIFPVSRRPELIVSWPNLAFVCRECNREKLDYYSETDPLINPFVEEPGDHITFYGPWIVHMTTKGYVTRTQIGLGRVPLLERRKERLEQILLLIERWEGMEDGDLRDVARAEIVREVGADREYSLSARSFAYQRLGWPELAPGA